MSKRKQVKTPNDEELLHRSVQGIEKKLLPHLLCVTNLLHGIDVPTNVRHSVRNGSGRSERRK